MFLKSVSYFDIAEAGNHDLTLCLINVAGYWFMTMLPLFFIVLIVTIPVNLAQTGFSFSMERFQPDFNRFNPVNGLKKIIGKQAFAELLKSLIKLVILGYFPYKLFVDEYVTMTTLFNATLGDSLDYIAWLMVKLILQMGLVLIIYGLFDLAYTRWKHIEDLKMTKQEVKEERKQTEGDPQIRGKIRQKQREMAQRNMMSQVPSADVVVTNPTHYAVALKYDKTKSEAPMVVAKGKDLIAFKIREIAEKNGVPIRENKPLAQALYRQVELDMEIPEDLYAAVAGLLAEIYKMSSRKA
jgi:flagellar biosynthetic protein FlhB